MSQTDKDGGSAFPVLSELTHRDNYYGEKSLSAEMTGGMSLRDWFAALALQALDVQAHVAPPAAANLARSAYAIADAMLSERENRSDEK